MSSTELTRAEQLLRVAERRTTQAEVARELGLTVRHVERLYAAYKRNGPSALVSKQRGQPSNRRLTNVFRETVMSLVRVHYADFGPTLAREKLLERHGIAVSVETLRTWMSADGLWRSHKERRKRAQPPRYRRSCLGELVQIDGSDHEWFEDRGPRCTLLVYVDDATSQLMQLYFARSESTFDYFNATKNYLREHGKPMAFYSDKATIFRCNAKEARGGDGVTQFGRAMSDLNIDVICANTPAAKGRVERANQTLQDRLVKELRLRGISNRDAGNDFLEEFRHDYNRRFARVAANERDAHRALLPHENLERILSWQETRCLTTNLALHYKRVMYIVDASAAAEQARGKTVNVREEEDGTVHIEYRGVALPARAFPKDARVHPGAIVENKLLGQVLGVIAQAQQKRDADTLANKRLTLRDEDLMRKEMGEPRLVTRRPTKPRPRASKRKTTLPPISNLSTAELQKQFEQQLAQA